MMSNYQEFAPRHACIEKKSDVFLTGVQNNKLVYEVVFKRLQISLLISMNANINKLTNYAWFRQHFGSDVTSASFAFNWSWKRRATLTSEEQRYVVALTRNKGWLYVTTLPKCWLKAVYITECHSTVSVKSIATMFNIFCNCTCYHTYTYRMTLWLCMSKWTLGIMQNYVHVYAFVILMAYLQKIVNSSYLG